MSCDKAKADAIWALGVLIFLTLFAPCKRAVAQFEDDYSWDVPIGDWSVPSNWLNQFGSSPGPPGADDNAWIDNGGTAQVTSGVGSIDGLHVGYFPGESGTVEVTGGGSLSVSQVDVGVGALDMLNGGDLQSNSGSLGDQSGRIGSGAVVDGPGSSWNNSSTLTVGNKGKATLDIRNSGQVSTRLSWIGGDQAASGTVTVDDGSWIVSDWLQLRSNGGDADLVISNGGYVYTGNTTMPTYIGSFLNTSGDVHVTGPGSELETRTQLQVGKGGEGSLTVDNGAEVSVGHITFAGVEAGSSGTIVVDGSGSQLLSAHQVNVGLDGEGSLTVSNGAFLSSFISTSSVETSGVAGGNASGVGEITLTGAGSRWTQDGSMTVGYLGQGMLLIEQGGAIESDYGHIAREPGSIGDATVTNPGSYWTVTNDMYIGCDADGPGGMGTLHVLNGGAVNIGGTLKVCEDGAIDLDGGAVSAATLQVGGVLSGVGTFGDVTMTAGSTLSPGNSPGTLQTGDMTWIGAGNYNWEIFDGLGAVGVGYDLLDVVGTLDVSGADGYDINLWSLSSIGPDTTGDAINFNNSQSYSWTLAQATGGVIGFDAADFNIVTSPNNGTGGFSNSLSNGVFSLNVVGNGLVLEFSAIPEPSTVAMLATLGVSAFLAYVWRRRKAGSPGCA